MVSHRVHKKIDQLVLGEVYPEVHKTLDSMVKFYGSRHRQKSPHDITSLVLFADNPKKMYSALLHLFVDRLETLIKSSVYENPKRRRKR